MRCEEALNQLNARSDGELPAANAAALEAHLAECTECRAEVATLQAIDAELRRAFAPRREAASRLADSAIDAIRTHQVAPTITPPSLASSQLLNWSQLLIGLAAGFLLAMILFRPWQTPEVANSGGVTQIMPIAHLAVASAPVEVQAATDAALRNQCATGQSIRGDSIVRTGANDRCEIAMVSGAALRLDCDTEVKLCEPEGVEISRGRLSSTIPATGKGLEFKLYGCPVFAQPAAQIAVDCQPNAGRLIVVDGTANIQAGKNVIEVGAGKQLRFRDGVVQSNPELCDTALETAWVNSVLALGSSDHPELAARVNQLLANIGAAKLSLMYEDELRRLGDAGVPPLFAYLSSTRETPDLPQRAIAARIVADVAETRWIGDLIALLTDPSGEVRFNAARGLERLTGRDQGFGPAAWRTGTWMTCEPPHGRWLAWWAANRDHYPSARREIAKPTTPPF